MGKRGRIIGVGRRGEGRESSGGVRRDGYEVNKDMGKLGLGIKW